MWDIVNFSVDLLLQRLNFLISFCNLHLWNVFTWQLNLLECILRHLSTWIIELLPLKLELLLSDSIFLRKMILNIFVLIS